MLYVIIDLALVAIVLICVWRGISKGMILSVAGLLALVITFFCAKYVADNYSDMFTDVVTPFVGGLVDEAAAEEFIGHNDSDLGSSDIAAISQKIFMKLGMSENAALIKADEVSEGITDLGDQLKKSISVSFVGTVSYVFTFAIAFLLINIAFAVVLNLTSIVFKMPGLRILNTVGGAVAGLIYGLLMVFAIAWVIRFLGFIVPNETVEQTSILKWLMNTNPLLGLMGF